MAAPYAFTHSREGKGMVTSGHSLWLPHRLREPPEQRTLDVVLRMPLHGEHPRLAVRWLGALDHTVGRPGRGARSEERRVGKECRSGWRPEDEKEEGSDRRERRD